MPSGGVSLDGGPVLSEGEASVVDFSDVSSVVTIGDRLAPSDTEDDDRLHDRQKYRLPDPGKTRLHLRTKEPLSPSARPVSRSPRLQTNASTPVTPQATQANAHWLQQSPIWPGIALRNGSTESLGDITNDFASRNVSRANSIYTLGRASLQDQLAHLTSLRLPDPNSLARKISSIPTALEATKALSDAAEQIRIWISKASEVLHSLSAEDDVEWAAAGGRDGIDDVDAATDLFQNLVEVYVLSIERLQTRDDVATLPAETLQGSVKQMEGIVEHWQKVKDTLRSVKKQVELAMEWEELWNTVLGEAGQEMDALNRLIFEMEEKRHQGAESLLSSKDSIDLHELETIVERRPGHHVPLHTHSHRLSLPGPFPPSPPGDAVIAIELKDEASLLALFARMQPLRAALDFLPMRLLTFTSRGTAIFPSACSDLEKRREQLEVQWKKLENDAESLRRELGEDRWVLVFRNAGRQALKMEESISRSFNKLKEALDAQEYALSSPGSSFPRKVESYEAKKAHYGPAIERVLAIIDRGVKDRLTVNGEILRLQSDMTDRWTALQADMREMDIALEVLDKDAAGEKTMRDSVSTVVSSEQRSVASSLVLTPGSSPASSVVGAGAGSGNGGGSRTPTPLMLPKSRRVGLFNSSGGGSGSAIPISISRRIPLTKSGEFTTGSPSASASPLATRSTNTRIASHSSPASSQHLSPSNTTSRPRWQTPTRPENRDFLPLSALEPSPYAKAPVVKHVNFLRSASSPIASPSTSTSTLASTSTLGSGRTGGLGRKVSMAHLGSNAAATSTPVSASTPASVSTPASASNSASTSTPTSTSAGAATEPKTMTSPPPMPKIPALHVHNASRKSALPLPVQTQTQTPARPSLASRKSHSTLRSITQLQKQPQAPQKQPVPASRRTSVLPAPPAPPLPPSIPPKFSDGNDADTESPAHHHQKGSRRSESALSSGRRSAASGRRSVDSRVRARAASAASVAGNGFRGGSAGGNEGGERPKWRS